MKIKKLEPMQVIDKGFYEANIIDIKQTESKFKNKDGSAKYQLEWSFGIIDAKVNKKVVDGITKRKFWTSCFATSDNSLGKILVSLGLDINGDIDTDDLVSLPIQVTIINEMDKDGNKIAKIASFDKSERLK